MPLGCDHFLLRHWHCVKEGLHRCFAEAPASLMRAGLIVLPHPSIKIGLQLVNGIDNLVERGLDTTVPRLFIIDGSKALFKALRRTFGGAAAIQRCQVHKARNILERLPKSLHASVRRVLRQAWELDDADKAEKLIRNLARRLERDWSGVSGSILEGIEEILTVTRLGLPQKLRRSLACTNIIENVMGTVRRVCRNVKRWRSASMAMRWTAAAMQEAAKGFRRLKAHKQLPALRGALEAHQTKNSTRGVLARQANAA
jgi:putative transposase